MKSSKKPTKQVVSTGTLKGTGSEPELSALIGGVGNTKKNATKSYPKGK